MDETRAREILGHMIQPDGSLVERTITDYRCIEWPLGDKMITIRNITIGVEVVEAIAWWMRNKGAQHG